MLYQEGLRLQLMSFTINNLLRANRRLTVKEFAIWACHEILSKKFNMHLVTPKLVEQVNGNEAFLQGLITRNKT